MQVDLPREAHLGRWLLIGSFLFWLLGIVGVFSFSNAHQLLVHRSAVTVLEAASALLMWWMTRMLLRRGMHLRTLVVISGAVAYLLAFLCSVLTDIITSAIPFAGMRPSSWATLLPIGIVGASLFSFPLLACTAIYLVVLYGRAAQERERRLLRAETLSREAELRALRSELTPHFLFNTLNGISTLVGEGNTQDARRMIARLADFLRTTLQESGHADIPLELEFQRASEYLAIEQIRLGDRLLVTCELDDDVRDVQVPNLLLQPLVENAVRHGIVPDVGGGELIIRASHLQANLRISVENSVDTDRALETGSGLGLSKTRERLAARYGSAFHFDAGLDTNSRWCVTIDMPIEQKGGVA